MPLEGIGSDELGAMLAKQKAAHLRDGAPSAEQRIDWLDRAIDLLVTHGDALNAAMAADFGHRSADQTGLTDIAGSIGPLKHSKKHLR
ncbi:MAG: coniferyl aldehyde dehydrogenase, partial [Pseudomonadota bacterium]